MSLTHFLIILNLFLIFQNGSLWDGLALWRNNVVRRYEGVEECYVCYCVLSGANYQLPKLSCRTCRKKFHTACLVSTNFFESIIQILCVISHFILDIFIILSLFFFSTNGSKQATNPPVPSAEIFSNVCCFKPNFWSVSLVKSCKEYK